MYISNINGYTLPFSTFDIDDSQIYPNSILLILNLARIIRTIQLALHVYNRIGKSVVAYARVGALLGAHIYRCDRISQ